MTYTRRLRLGTTRTCKFKACILLSEDSLQSRQYRLSIQYIVLPKSTKMNTAIFGFCFLSLIHVVRKLREKRPSHQIGVSNSVDRIVNKRGHKREKVVFVCTRKRNTFHRGNRASRDL